MLISPGQVLLFLEHSFDSVTLYIKWRIKYRYIKFSFLEISDGTDPQSYLEEIDDSNRDEDNVSLGSIDMAIISIKKTMFFCSRTLTKNVLLLISFSLVRCVALLSSIVFIVCRNAELVSTFQTHSFIRY